MVKLRKEQLIAVPGPGLLKSDAAGTVSVSDDGSKNYGATGQTTGGLITDAGGATVNVDLGTGFLRTTDSETGVLEEISWITATSQAIPTDTTRFIGVKYNSGSPQIVIKTTDSWNKHDEFSLGTVVNENNILHIMDNPEKAINGIMNLIHRLYETSPLQRAERLGGIRLGETGTRNVTVSAGELYDRSNEFPISNIDTSGADTFDTYLNNVLDTAAVSQWDNDSYNNAGVKTSLTVNRYANLWFYVESDGDLVMLYGNAQYVTGALAENEAAPSVLPERLIYHGRLIGRMIFQKGDSTAILIESVFDETFNPSLATDHNSLANLTIGDVHTQYVKKDGRAGGETIIGGTGPADDLAFETTSDSTKGKFLFGTSAYDEVTNRLGIGLNSPTSQAHIKGSLTVAITGTLSITIGTPNVVGIGTLFTTELQEGDSIKIANEVFTVNTITDALNLILDSNHSAGASGVTAYSDPDLIKLDNGDGVNKFIVDKSGKIAVNGIPSANENDILLNLDGVMAMKETTTPTADMDIAKIYAKADNNLYFQDGAGVEKTLSVDTFVIINKTGSYTLQDADKSSLIVVNSASAVTITVPETSTEAIAAGTNWTIYNINSGDVTIAKEGSDVLNGNTLVAQGAFATVIKRIAGSPNTYDVSGGTSIQTFTIEHLISGTLVNGSFVFSYPEFAGTIIDINAVLVSGTADLDMDINGTGITHTTLSLSSTKTNQAPSALNVFAKGDALNGTISNATSPVQLLLSLECIGRL